MESYSNDSLRERLPKDIEDISYDNYNISKYISDSIISFSRKEKLSKLKKPEIINFEFNILQKIIDNEEKHYEQLSNQNKKDRYSNIRTYKYNSIKLKSKEYINASFIHLPLKKYFIATQGPIKSSINDFWEMILEYNTKIIIMLCNQIEGGREKCTEYWKGNMLYNIKYTEEKKENLIKRNITISNNKLKKEIIQFQYIGWPDHGIPNLNDAYKYFIYIIEFILKNYNNSPVVVHCSAGVGRTGTFISIFNLVYEIICKKNLDVIQFSIFNTVRKLKEMRMFLVQNEEQYNFIYDFIKTFLEIYFKVKK